MSYQYARPHDPAELRRRMGLTDDTPLVTDDGYGRLTFHHDDHSAVKATRHLASMRAQMNKGRSESEALNRILASQRLGVSPDDVEVHRSTNEFTPENTEREQLRREFHRAAMQYMSPGSRK